MWCNEESCDRVVSRMTGVPPLAHTFLGHTGTQEQRVESHEWVGGQALSWGGLHDSQVAPSQNDVVSELTVRRALWGVSTHGGRTGARGIATEADGGVAWEEDGLAIKLLNSEEAVWRRES